MGKGGAAVARGAFGEIAEAVGIAVAVKSVDGSVAIGIDRGKRTCEIDPV